MSFDRDHFEKPLAKLRKIIRKRQALGDPDRVHKLRTNIRRLEAILGAVDLLPAGEKKKLLRGLKRVRRSAGVVRDMDILTLKAADVDVDGERNCRIQLLHHLGQKRERASRKLRKQLKQQGKNVRLGLKHGERAARRLASSRHGSDTAVGRAAEISVDLQHFATMNRRNLHEFRKQAKQLRYVLQLSRPANEKLLGRLRAMQDAIGEWHDWEELVEIARKALPHGQSCALLRELRLHADSSFDEALRVANQFRRDFLRLRPGPIPIRVGKTPVAMAA